MLNSSTKNPLTGSHSVWSLVARERGTARAPFVVDRDVKQLRERARELERQAAELRRAADALERKRSAER